jgi:hypothetical protein
MSEGYLDVDWEDPPGNQFADHDIKIFRDLTLCKINVVERVKRGKMRCERHPIAAPGNLGEYPSQSVTHKVVVDRKYQNCVLISKLPLGVTENPGVLVSHHSHSPCPDQSEVKSVKRWTA